MTVLLRLDWTSDTDIFTVRRHGREIAAALGAGQQDQTRVATALSEIGRDLRSSSKATVVFSMADAPARLVVTVSTRHLPRDGDATAPTGIAAARRLLDDLDISREGEAWSIRLTKRLPPGVRLGPTAVTRVRAALKDAGVASPLEELRAQNAELVNTLDELTAQKEELLRLNAELEETNRGVLAMYGQLSDELEETNRGVVALYAELDDKSRLLVEANEAKTRFLRNVSHELRTPVSSILGLADLLSAGELLGEQQKQVEYLRGSARSLLGLVNELLDLARAESGRVEMRIEAVDLRLMFGELRGTLRPVAADRGVDLVIEEPEVETLSSDAELLARVLRNLLMNGIKFTEPGGRVRMSTVRRESGQHLEITVTDTGVGIPPEFQERVFEDFFQVPGQLQAGGTGLGLPYARSVTTSLGGTLELTGSSCDGSTFTVVLPLLSERAPPDAGDVDLGHVLIVDDDAAFRHVVRGMLQGIATRVSEAADGEEALRLIGEVRPDVVLLDLRMPRLDGAGLLAALRAEPHLRDLPVVLMTSVAIDAEVRRAAEPAAAFLAKSELTRELLVHVVPRALAGDAPGSPRRR